MFDTDFNQLAIVLEQAAQGIKAAIAQIRFDPEVARKIQDAIAAIGEASMQPPPPHGDKE